MNKSKTIVSNILHRGSWHNVNDTKPAEGQKVVIRFVDPEFIEAESETEILLREDLKVAEFVRDYNDKEQGEWVIQPPYLKYDFSPLSNREKINKEAHVTHWREASEEELDNWLHRLDPINKYNHLVIEVDPEFEEGVYRSLVWGCNMLAKSSNRYKALAKQTNDKEEAEKIANRAEDLSKMANALMDLQTCFDHGKGFINGEFVKIDRGDAPTDICEDITKLEERIKSGICDINDVNHLLSLQAVVNSAIYDIYKKHYGDLKNISVFLEYDNTHTLVSEKLRIKLPDGVELDVSTPIKDILKMSSVEIADMVNTVLNDYVDASNCNEKLLFHETFRDDVIDEIICNIVRPGKE